jgi:DNA polymerase III subunit delta
MYKGELDKHIQNSSTSNSFVFFGESSFLIDSYTKRLSNIEDASALIFYYDEYDFKSAKAHLSQASLFGGVNVLVVKSEKKFLKKS